MRKAMLEATDDRLEYLHQELINHDNEIIKLQEQIKLLQDSKIETKNKISMLSEARVLLVKEIDQMEKIEKKQESVGIPEEQRHIAQKTAAFENSLKKKKRTRHKGAKINANGMMVPEEMFGQVKEYIRGEFVQIADLKLYIYNQWSAMSQKTINKYLTNILNELSKSNKNFVRDKRKVKLKTIRPSSPDEIEEWMKREKERINELAGRK